MYSVIDITKTINYEQNTITLQGFFPLFVFNQSLTIGT